MPVRYTVDNFGFVISLLSGSFKLERCFCISPHIVFAAMLMAAASVSLPSLLHWQPPAELGMDLFVCYASEQDREVHSLHLAQTNGRLLWS